jgi:hypothetical protein
MNDSKLIKFEPDNFASHKRKKVEEEEDAKRDETGNISIHILFYILIHFILF